MEKETIILKCESQNNPIGIDFPNPHFSWKLTDRNYLKQKNVRILVAQNKEDLLRKKNLLWDYQSDTEEMQTRYMGQELESRKVYFWKIELTTIENVLLHSPIQSFETGFMDKNCWKAHWIKISEKPLKHDMPEMNAEGDAMPVVFDNIQLGTVYQVRKEFSVKRKPQKARLYITAHGIYVPMLNGVKVGNLELTPGHSDYSNQLFYQIYDMTDLLLEGQNTIGAYIADGWYRSRIGFPGDNCQYGDELSLLLQLELTYEDGTCEVIASDETFQISEGAFEYADMMVGEKYDARKELIGFFENGYSGMFRYPCIQEGAMEHLRADIVEPVKEVEILEPVAIYSLNNNEFMVDFGKCIAGWVSFEVSGTCGQEIRLEHSEVEGANHTFQKNILTAYREQTHVYICKGNVTEKFRPYFSYQGFRYVKVSGTDILNTNIKLKAHVIASVLDTTSQFDCSDQRLNQLYKNIIRSQMSNMISIPTDCPQREKVGWTGDVQIYAATACLNQNTKEFYRRWLNDVRYGQSADGQIPIIVPFTSGHSRAFEGVGSSAGWSDVIIELPWTLYQYYDDKYVLKENFEAMEKWVEYIRHTAETENPDKYEYVTGELKEHLKYIWNTNFHFGDWLTPSVSINAETGIVDLMQSALRTMDIVPTFFYASSCKLMSQISEVLELPDKKEYYDMLFNRIKKAFQFVYLNEDMTIKSNLQGIQVLALHTGLVEGKSKEKTVEKLVQLIHANNDRLDTGFLSVKHLMDVLCENGHRQLAYNIFYNEECPSWLYEVKMGATSIWESWQAILPDGRCSNVSMQHYAFGCIQDWIFRNIVGIQKLAPGYKKIRFKPDFQCGLNFVKGSYDSIYGEIICAWKIIHNEILIDVVVPFNTSAELAIGEKTRYLSAGEHHFKFKKGEIQK